MTMCGIQHDHVHFCLYQCLYPLQYIGCDTHGSAAQKTPLFVLCGQRVLDLLLNIFNCNKPF